MNATTAQNLRSILSNLNLGNELDAADVLALVSKPGSTPEVETAHEAIAVLAKGRIGGYGYSESDFEAAEMTLESLGI